MKENWEINWKDYFEILQLHPSAEPEVIKGAYEKLAKKYHPDLNSSPEAAGRIKDINDAYSVLSNPDKKQSYYRVWLIRQKNSTGNKHPHSNPPYSQPYRPHSTGHTRNSPKPVSDKPFIYIPEGEPGVVQTASFTIRNEGGPFQKVLVGSTPPWLKIKTTSLTDSKLPLKVDIFITGSGWGTHYTSAISFKLDDQECNVTIDYRTFMFPPKPNTPGQTDKVKSGLQLLDWFYIVVAFAIIFALIVFGLL